jgi:transcriptional regulator with XRE-family HTH domain
MGTPGTPLDPSRRANARARALEKLAQGLSLTAAAAAADVSRQTLWNWRQADPEFEAQVLEAIEAGTDVLEDEARRRAVEGTLRPVYQSGKLVGHVREYSDQLTVLLLKGRRPDRYRERVDVHQSAERATPTQARSLDLRERLGDEAWHEHAEAMAARVQEQETSA